MKTKTLLITLAAFAIIWGGLGYWASMQPSASPVATTITDPETKTWKAYKDSQRGIEFKYPSEWTLAGQGTLKFKTTDLAQASFQVTQGDLPKDTKYEVISYQCEQVNPCGWYLQYALASGIGVRVYIEDPAGEIEQTLAAHQVPDFAKHHSKDLETIRRVVGTFVSTSAWKSYTNLEYGFEVKYPDDYKVINSGRYFVVTPNVAPEYEGGIGGVGITFNTNSESKSLDVACYLKESQSDPAVKNVKKVIFLERDAIYSEDYATGQIAGYCFLWQNNIVNVSYDLGSERNIAILSTLRLAK